MVLDKLQLIAATSSQATVRWTSAGMAPDLCLLLIYRSHNGTHNGNMDLSLGI